MGATEDRLFERWCRHGEAGALGELFDLASPGLLRLAIHLVGEPSEAEDLVQATFLAAIEQRARLDSSRPVLPWLTAVLSNKAADFKRRAGRSRHIAPWIETAGEDASRPAEQRELGGELAKAIDALEEPYRQVMILRLRHGLSPADIAHVLARSPGAVRVQLHRAQQKLRGRLPSTLAGAFLAVADPARGLAAVRAEVMAKALSAAPAASFAAATATVLGGLVMSKKLSVAIAVGVLAAGAWWIAGRQPAPEPSTLDSDARGQLARASLEVSAEPPAPSTEEQRVAVRGERPAATDAHGSLDIEVVWSDGSPAAGIGLQQLGSASTLGRSTFWRADSSGRVRIDRIRAGPREFLLDRWSKDPAFRQTFKVDVLAGAHSHLCIEVPAGRDVHATVLDARGQAVAGAELQGSWSSWAGQSWLGQTAQDGSCFIRSLPAPDYYLFASAEGRGISRSVSLSEFRADSRGVLVAELYLSSTAAQLAGRVHGTSGEPVADADVIVTLDADTSVSRRLLRERTLADGSFRFPGLCRSRLRIEVGAADHPLWTSQLQLEDGQSQWLDVRLQEGVTVVGTVRTSDGAPSVASVEWAENASLRHPGDLAWKRVRCTADAAGAYRLTGLPPGPIHLRAERFLSTGSPGRAEATLKGAPGATLHWDPVLEAGAGEIAGRVVDEAGAPQVGWFVDAVAYGAVGRAGRSAERTDEGGRFEFRGCADVDHVLRLQWPEKGTLTPVDERDFVRPGSAEVVFVVSPGRVPTASLSGVVLDSEGAPVEHLSVSAEDELGLGRGRCTYEPTGRFEIELLTAGRYRLSCLSSLLAEESLGTFELHPGQALDVGTLTLAPRGFLAVSMRRSDGVAPAGPMSRIAAEEGAALSLGAESSEDGILFRGRGLAPGRYLLYPIFANAAAPMREFWIRPGETTSLDVELEPAARRMLAFRVPAELAPPPTLAVEIFDASGATYLDAQCRTLHRDRDGYWSHSLLASFPPGSYRFDASCELGLAASGSFEIPSVDAPFESIDVELRRRL